MMKSRPLRLSRAATLLTIVVMAWQVNLPVSVPHFDVASLPLSYLAPAVSLAEITAVLAIVSYALAGWPNFTTYRSGWRKLFSLALAGLVLFETLSILWSIHWGLAAVQVLHVAVWAAFAVLIACAAWPASTMTLAMLLGLLIHSLAGFIQISIQPVVSIIPQNSGVSVVFSGAEHWQRIYGLSPHPNLLGGHLAVGVILTIGLILTHQGRRRFWLMAAWLICWITLLLTFSRSAWLAVMGGSITAWLLLRRGRQMDRPLNKVSLTLLGLGLVTIIVFVLGFQPFLINRIDVAFIPYETQAIVERLNAARLAIQIFAAHPLAGVGLSQFVLVARDLAGTPIDWVHNVPLLAAAELGVGGSALIGLFVITLVAVGVQRWRTRSISMWQALAGGGIMALVVVMQFDHYVWTMSQGGLLWAWLVGWWMRDDHRIES